MPKIRLEKLSAIEKINSEFDKLNKAETTEKNIGYLNELENKKAVLIREIKNIEENIKKFALPLTIINYRVLLVEHINPEEAY